MKPRHLLLIASIAAFTISAVSATGAFAGERYATLPQVALSPALAAPWIAQLQAQPVTHTQVAIDQPVRIDAEPVRPAQRTSEQAKPQNASYSQGALVGQSIATPSVAKPQIKKTRAKHAKGIDPIFLPQDVRYNTSHKSGTIVIDTKNKFLYHVGANGMARRYGVGVGKQGFSWKGSETVSRKAKWPAWHPPQAMIVRERKKGKILPVRMEGGSANPLGARALYLGSTLYRIHGTNAPSTIGKAVSSGCIRMRNQDVEELYANVPVGTKVVVQ